MRKYKDDCRYFNFPITLIKNFLEESEFKHSDYYYKACLEAIWNYALYVKAQEYTFHDKKHEKIREALNFYNVKYTNVPTNKLLNEVYDGGENLYFQHKGNAMTGIETNKYFEFKNNKSTSWDKAQLLGVLAIKSIISKKKYNGNTTILYVLSRMDGNNKQVANLSELSPDLMQHFPTINDAGEKVRQGRWNKFITILQDNWYLKYYPTKMRGFYVSFNMTKKALIKKAISTKKSTKKEIRKKEEKEAEREIMEELGLIKPTQDPKPTKPQEEPTKEDAITIDDVIFEEDLQEIRDAKNKRFRLRTN